MLAVAGIALLLVFVSLGVWQVKRLAWKVDLIQRVEQRLSMPPGELPAQAWLDGFDASTQEYLPVQTEGHWLYPLTVLTQATTELGSGYWVLTPLQRPDGNRVLVNRGFVPAQQREQWLNGGAVPGAAAVVKVTGLLRLTEPEGGYLRRNDPGAQRWFSRDVAAIAQASGLTQVAPFFIDAGLPDATPRLPDTQAPGTWPREGLTVVRFSNSHLVYAVTWFGLAAMVLAAMAFVVRYERRLRQLGQGQVQP